MATKASKPDFAEYNRPELMKLLSALRLDVDFSRGEGDYLYYKDVTGAEIGVLDLAGGMGSTILGHNNPKIVATIRKNLDRGTPMHAQGSARSSAGRVGRLLSDLYPGREKRITIMTNSGTEAAECALKHAEMNRMKRLEAIGKRLHRNVLETRRHLAMHPGATIPKPYREKGAEALLNEILMQCLMLEAMPAIVISTEKSFHGKTTAAVRVTGNPLYRQAFAHLSGIDARFVEFNNAAELADTIESTYFTIKTLVCEGNSVRIAEERHPNITAFIMEPVQGEGGINVATTAFMKSVERLKRRHGFEWILDEIQSGLGRTGRMFAVEHYPINKDAIDYVLLSKSLGGGTNKVGAVLIKNSIHDPMFGILHTSTFAEDGPSSEVAAAALEILRRNKYELVRACARKGDYFMEKLRALHKDFPTVIKEVRGLGLMIGVEFTLFEDNSSLFFKRTGAQGLFGSALTGYLFHEHRIRTAPPLNSMVSKKPSNIIRIEPSAYIDHKDIDRVVSAIRRACEIIQKSNAYEFSKFVIGKETPGHYPPIPDRAAPIAPSTLTAEFEECPRMAFLIHPLDVHQIMEAFDPSLSEFSREIDPATGKSERDRFWDILGPLMDSFVYRTVDVKSPRTGDRVRAYFIAFMMTTKQMNETRKTDPGFIIDGIQKAVDLGTSLGARIAGLGAFTSIVTHNGTALDDTFIHITSGNSYTAALVWQSVIKTASYAGVNLGKCTGAVVGAGGNIGSVAASLLAEDIPKLILIGSRRAQSIERLTEVAASIYSDMIDIIRTTTPEKLRGLPAALATDILMPFLPLTQKPYRFNHVLIDEFIATAFSGRDLKIANLVKSVFYERTDPDIGLKILQAIAIKHNKDPYLELTTDIKKAIPRADIVISAVSSDTEIMEASWFKPGAIVNDASLPPSVSSKIYKERPDVIAIQGGIGHLPEYIDLGIPGLAIGATLGCMAETFILSMMNMIDNYSFGNISRQLVIKIWEAGRILGFGLAAVKFQGDKKLTRELAAEIRNRSTGKDK